MPIESYDCVVCYNNGVHESNIKHFECGHSICTNCIEKHKYIIDDDDEDEIIYKMVDGKKITMCDDCLKFNNYEKMLNLLLTLYNKRRKNKLTIDDLLKRIPNN